MAVVTMHNRYGNMVFPEYKFREYPKMIYPDGNLKKPGIIVQDKDEEARVLGTFKAQEPVKVVVEPPAPAKEEPVAEVESPKYRPRPRAASAA